MTQEESNLARVRAFFAAIQDGGEPSELAAFYAEDVVQEEFPNAFLPRGATRDLEALHGKIAAQRNYDCFYPW